MAEDGIELKNEEAEFIALPNEVYIQALHEVIKNNCNLTEDQYEIQCCAGSAKGDNYIGIVYRVSVKSKQDNSVKLNLIVKLPPQNAARREQFFVRPCFIREADFYNNLYPMYKQFQEEKGIDVEKDGFHEIPFCFKALTDDPFEGLYFDDLKASGFEMFDRFQNVTKEQVLIVMKTLAKMHAVFYCIKDQKPELIEHYRDMVDIFLQRKGDENMNVWFESVKNRSKDTITECGNEDMIKKVNDLLSLDFFELLETCINGEAAEPYAIVCHGDCWNNNIMYKYDQSGTPNAIRLLDFQIIRYSSPVLDLMYYIFGCTVKSLRDKHYQEFMDVYYDTLADFIKRLGSNPDKVFPREAFNEHLKKFGKFGFIMAMMVLPMFTANAEDIPDMDAMAEKFQDLKETGEKLDPSEIVDFSSFKTVDVFNERMRDVIQDMYDFGYF
ncbi:hypothetical protein ACKWTF_006353 [Chironomus riparius]